MDQIIQLAAVLGFISLSVAYLVRYYWKKHKAKTGCPSCKLMHTVAKSNQPPAK